MANQEPKVALGDDVDVLCEILSRLPIRDILRFRSINRTWKSRIDGPEVSASLAARDREANSILALEVAFGSGLFTLHRGPDSNMATPLEGLEHAPIFNHGEDVQSVGGLICFQLGLDTILLNPTNKESKMLPPASHTNFPHLAQYGPDCFRTFSALGLDPASGHYVVLKTWVPIQILDEHVLPAHMVLRSGCGPWRNLDASGPLECTFGGAITADGAIFFLSFDRKSFVTLVAFHLGTETFHTLSLPADHLKNRSDLKIIAFNDHLTVVDFKRDYLGVEARLPVHLYVLEDYTRQDWKVIQMVIPVHLSPAATFHLNSIRAGELVIVLVHEEGDQPYLFLYQVEMGEFSRMNIHGVPEEALQGFIFFTISPIGFQTNTQPLSLIWPNLQQ